MRTVATRRRSRYLLLVLTLLAVTFITLDARGVPIFDGARNTASDVFAPVSGAADWVTSPFRNAWQGVTGYDELQERNRRLREELGRLRAKEITGANAEEQLKRLNDQLQLGFVRDLPTQVARVTSGPFSNFSDHRLEIDKGSSSGLKEGMPVVTTAGLVGRLDRVSRTRSVVQLATDPSFVIGVRLASSQDLGVGRGGGDADRFIVDRGIELADPVEPGEAVLTSGLSDSVMPPDIPIGLVDKVIPDENTRSQLLQVRYAVDFSQLDVVQVLKWEPPR
ncbi:MAG: rod shape-determining protein MreC [Microthrixaceae bacterium]